ncbi:tellurium resistance protein TerA [Ventosimonas gracilis]|uniref:Tellurium resistance protein TerA n=1 Tax=Ventosimonas gracilis TaxID=1680762 RepID=A0A139SXC9_9GAMM|nr:TerD family protein [Ventosimonas gracilis]KXU39283.1 tellurium resistance protein TerA [Ventosimonas gracilis]
MTSLIPGGNAPVATSALQVRISYSPLAAAEIDFSAFALTTSGKVRGDGDMCFYGQKSLFGGALQLSSTSSGNAGFDLDLAKIDETVEKIALCATIHENKATFAQVAQLALTVSGGIEAQIPTQDMPESALILGEFYRRQGQWKFRCVAQGFAGGLEPLAKHFGVSIAAAKPPAAPTPAQSPAAEKTSNLNLSKISLDKSRASISLEKGASGGFGEIKINLNWTQGGNAKSGFFDTLLGRNKGIDLDLGCLIEMQDGSKGVVQALGDAFGRLNDAPYIQLMGDDRTGSVSNGEWLHINGEHWNKIKRVLVYAFIYEGAPNWKATDGVVTVYAPGQPPIEVRMNEEGGQYGMCAIALFENERGTVKVSRLVKFYNGHEDMDRANDWGLRWTAGSK